MCKNNNIKLIIKYKSNAEKGVTFIVEERKRKETVNKIVYDCYKTFNYSIL